MRPPLVFIKILSNLGIAAIIFAMFNISYMSKRTLFAGNRFFRNQNKASLCLAGLGLASLAMGTILNTGLQHALRAGPPAPASGERG